jgi:nucleoside-triphosphatase
MSLLLLTGPRGAGKTTACISLVQQLDNAGLTAGGILTPARYDQQGAKTGFDVVDVATNRRRALGTVATAERATVGRYRMDGDAMRWAVGRVLNALQTPFGLVIIDEIGPLEVFKGGGFAPALEALPTAQARNILLIVRPELVEQVQEIVSPLPSRIVRLDIANRDRVPAHMAQALD